MTKEECNENAELVDLVMTILILGKLRTSIQQPDVNMQHYR